MKAMDQPPLRALSDAVEEWSQETSALYEELQTHLEQARLHLSVLENQVEARAESQTAPRTAPDPVSAEPAATVPPEDLAALRGQVAALISTRDALEQEVAALREKAALADVLGEQMGALEEELARERSRNQLLREELEMTEEVPAPAAPPVPATRAAEAPRATGYAVPAIRAFDAQGHKKRMGQILVDEGIITAPQLELLLSEQSGAPQVRVGALAIERGYTNEALVAKVLAAQLRLPYVDVQTAAIDPQVITLLSSHLARLHRCLPLRHEGNRLVVAMGNPLDLIAIEDIELATHFRVEPVVASTAALETAIERYYPGAL
ncbi:MAG: hypothetical protein HYV26_19580 [Candidatus Hydrogenedentes bacterium]|nr:hypothetical protein [Candidatus Hydrogenedentota bacterium]